MAKLRSYSTSAWDELCRSVAPGEYRLYTDMDEMPVAIRTLAGFGASQDSQQCRSQCSIEDWRATLVFRSAVSTGAFTVDRVTADPTKTAFRVRNFRQDEDTEGPHQNADDNLLFVDSANSRVFKLHYSDDSEHVVRPLSVQSQLNGFLKPYGLADAPATGSVEDLRGRGALSSVTTGR